jgi:hypothetical protein
MADAIGVISAAGRQERQGLRQNLYLSETFRGRLMMKITLKKQIGFAVLMGLLPHGLSAA